MVYTVTKLAKLSGVSVRTLHFYDEMELLKPAYYGSNGYRYYEEQELLMLQQILFFRELGFELKQIQKLIKRGDFDKIVALSSHKKVLQKNLERTQQLIETIDKTIKHLKGKAKMKEHEIYHGFSKEKQADYEKQLIARFGDVVKVSIEESHRRVKDWSKADWERSNKEFDEICKGLKKAMENRLKPQSDTAQTLIQRHHKWINQFWTSDKKSYSIHGQLCADSDLRTAFEAYSPQLPEYIAEAIQHYAEHRL